MGIGLPLDRKSVTWQLPEGISPPVLTESFRHEGLGVPEVLFSSSHCSKSRSSHFHIATQDEGIHSRARPDVRKRTMQPDPLSVLNTLSKPEVKSALQHTMTDAYEAVNTHSSGPQGRVTSTNMMTEKIYPGFSQPLFQYEPSNLVPQRVSTHNLGFSDATINEPWNGQYQQQRNSIVHPSMTTQALFSPFHHLGCKQRLFLVLDWKQRSS